MKPYKGGRKKPDPIEEAGPSLNATGMMTGRQGLTVPGREVALSTKLVTDLKPRGGLAECPQVPW